MAPAAEDVLGELYAWDSVIEDDAALAAEDPQRDEDTTEDAYEQIIHTASGDASDIVLSLAAQLLHKHFFRFPHVQLNVVDVLLQLCGPKRSQAVRIHTLRALLQIVKTPLAAAAASTPTLAASIARKNTRMWMQRIDEAVQNMLNTEKSSVILRQVTPLRHALEERLTPDSLSQPQPKQNKSNGQEQNSQSSPAERNCKKPRDEKDVAGEDVYAPSERELKKPKHDDDARFQNDKPPSEGTIIKLKREPSNGGTPRDNDEAWKKQSVTPNGNDSNGGTPRDNDEAWKKQSVTPNGNDRLVENAGKRRPVNAYSPRNCPPCPYLFLGSVPRHTPSDEIVDFLGPVWPEINIQSVQIKQPDHNATAYAFVSMPSVEHAREAIHFVAANKFLGRDFLNANFARGPPVDTLLFLERTNEDVNMEDEGAVRDFDFSTCDPEVWDILCMQLERFGPLMFAWKGCVRYRSVDHAKAAIRKQLFTVKGYEIFPVYDTKEQFAIDSTRRGANVHSKQGFTLKSGRLVGGDTDYRSGKSRRYKDDDDPMDGVSGRRDQDRMTSLKYGGRIGSVHSRSPHRSDRESARGRSRSRSPKSGRYDVLMSGPPKERRLPHSRSRSPVTLAKQVARDIGYGTPSDKENRREYRSKYGHRSLSPVDTSVPIEEVRGRPRHRDGPWMATEDSRERRGPREERRGTFRHGSPSPASSSRRSRKDDGGKQRSKEYRRGGLIEEDRPRYRREEPLEEERGRIPLPPLSAGLLLAPRSHSRSPPRFGKYSSGSSKGGRRSRSLSPHPDERMGSSSNQRSSGYRGRDDRLIGNPLVEERPSLQSERPRYVDERSIAEVARDEQEERQRFFHQKQQSRHDFHDTDLSRYGAGRGGGRGRGRGGRGRGDRGPREYQPYRGGGRSEAMYRQELPPPQRRSPSPVPAPANLQSPSPPPQARRRSPSPLPPPQKQRESYGRERRGEFAPAPRGRNAGYSPPASPLMQNYGPSGHQAEPVGLLDRHEFDPEADGRVDRESSRHERRHHSRRDRSRDEKGHRSHRERREKCSSRPERSLTPSPVRRGHASGSSGRKSNGPSPRRSFSRRNDVENQAEEATGKDKQPRPKNEDETETQQKEKKNGGVRLVRDELFAGMDDLAVDYEEDDD